MRVAALYRYPVKGFAAEPCETLTVLEGGRIAGDRVLGFRFANATAAGDAWGTKHECIALVNTPGLARLRAQLDRRALRLRIVSADEVLADEPFTGGGRTRLAAAVQDYVLRLDENPLTGHATRLPVRLVGDGVAPRFQDEEGGFVTLHGRGSLAGVARAADAGEMSEARFRSNIAVEGLEAWEEQRWPGRRIRIGEVRFEALRAKTRCLATHANPRTGERDLPVLQALLRAFPAARPTFAIAMTSGRGGQIHVGDRVTIED